MLIEGHHEAETPGKQRTQRKIRGHHGLAAQQQVESSMSCRQELEVDQHTTSVLSRNNALSSHLLECDEEGTTWVLPHWGPRSGKNVRSVLDLGPEERD